MISKQITTLITQWRLFWQIRPIRAEIDGDWLRFYSHAGKLLGSVNRNEISDIWAVNIDLESCPAYSDWEILFITRGKRNYDIKILRVIAEHKNVVRTINEFLYSLNGRNLPGWYPDGWENEHGRIIDGRHEVRLLWERAPLNKRMIRNRIDWFEQAKKRVYIAALLLVAMAVAIGFWYPAVHWFIWIIAGIQLLSALGDYFPMQNASSDLKRIGIIPRWFGKTLNRQSSLPPPEAQKPTIPQTNCGIDSCNDMDCTIFIDCDFEESLLQSLLAEFYDCPTAGSDFTLSWGEIYISDNDVFDRRSLNDRDDGFLFTKFYLDVTKNETISDVEYIKNISELLERFWNKGLRAVCACDFEDKLPYGGGIQRW